MAAQSVAVNLAGSSVWAPFKDLNFAVEAVLLNKDVEAVPDFVAALRRHKPDFASLLQNPARSAQHRDAVAKASKEGIRVVGQTAPQVLPQSIVDEALIISDMLELNELVSLELLLAGQQQQPLFPELTRGLVAVLLYYDGRRALVNSLRTLVQVTEGRTWTLGLNTDVVATVTKYTDGLKDEDGVFMKVMDLLEKLDLARELDMLQRSKALGGPRYRKQVTDMIQETHQSLAEIVFCWSCQTVLSKEEALRLLKFVASSADTAGDGSLHGVTLTVLMALLYVMDVSVLQTCEDSSKEIDKLPLVQNPDVAVALHRHLSSDAAWKIEGLRAVVCFAWALTLRTFSQFPLVSVEPELAACLEDDERTMDAALEGRAFPSLLHLVVRSPLLHREEFFLKRMHGLLVDFIVLMPLRVKELRNQGDETARIVSAYLNDGLAPPSTLTRHFEHLLELIAEVYAKDPLELRLSEQYWCPGDVSDHSYAPKPSQRQVALFKFLRFSGDLLPPSLFTPYVSVLTSLAQSRTGAHHCFNLLKNNGRYSTGPQESLVSWDHFFGSLRSYYNSLRQEGPLSVESHLYRPPFPRGISSVEVKALIAVLQLVETVVHWDEVARITLAENPHHVPLALLVHLVGCGVAPELKAAFLGTLSAFATSPEVALKIWQCLEGAQILPVRQGGLAPNPPPGIQTELEEVEARNEEFPITRALLKLVSALVDHPLPSSAHGAALLRSGLDPYMDFVRDAVFLKFHIRAYKQEEEKWEVARLCLEIIEKLLRKHGVGPGIDAAKLLASDTPPLGTQVAFNLLAHLLQDGTFLRLILFVLDEGARQLETYLPFPGQKQLEEAALLSLRILHLALLQQEPFLHQVRNSNAALIVSSMNQLLMAANPRTGRPDYGLVISQYVTYNTFLPWHTLVASRILLLLCGQSKMAEHLATAFTFEKMQGLRLIHGFAESLDVDLGPDPPAGNERDWTLREVRTASSHTLLKMLLSCLEHPVLNVGHYLLGFDIKRSIAKTTLQEPGVLGSARTCLHAILSFLDNSSEARVPGGPPSVVELGYKLVYVLCANPATTEPTMRYLRSTRDFFYKHLQKQPKRYLKSHGDTDVKLLMQQSWFLRAVALELRVTASQNQRSHIQRLVTLLLEDNPQLLTCPIDGAAELSSFLSSSASMRPSAFAGTLRRKLLKLLDAVDTMKHTVPSAPTWEYLDSVELERALAECEYQEPGGPIMIDVGAVHQRLLEASAKLQGFVALGQKSMVVQEVKAVLQYTLAKNRCCQGSFAKRHYFLAWQQLVEVVVTVCPQDIFGGDLKIQVLLEVAQELLRRLLDGNSLTDLLAPSSGVLLVLMAALHHCLLTMGHLLRMSGRRADHSNVLTHLMPNRSTAQDTALQVSLTTYSSSILAVLKSLLECLIQTGSGFQRVRANYYGSLLNLLRVVHRSPETQGAPGGGVDRVFEDSSSDGERLRKSHAEALFSYGEQLMEVVCRDVCGSHEITQMLSLAALDAVVSLDTHGHWLSYLCRKGYLHHLTDGVSSADADIRTVLVKGSSKGSSLRSLYVLESKLSLLTRLAASPAGAQALLESGLVGKLAECEALDLYPSIAGGLPDLASRWPCPPATKCYQQLFVPVAQLLLSIAASLGPGHKEAGFQVRNFLGAHAQVFSAMLQPRNLENSDLTALEEAALASALVAVLADGAEDDDDVALLEHQGHLRMLQNQMLSLLSWLVPEADAASQLPHERILRLRISCSVFRFCSSLCRLAGAKDRKWFRILFAPTASVEAPPRSGRSGVSGVIAAPPPGLGLLVRALLAYSAEAQRTAVARDCLARKLAALDDLGSAELAELLLAADQDQPSSLQPGKLREAARRQIGREAALAKKELSLLTVAVEQALFLLWRHLEYFLVQCVPSGRAKRGLVRPAEGQFGTPMREGTLGRVPASEAVTVEDVEALKADVKATLNDAFFRGVQVRESYLREESASSSNPRFFEALLRRLKRLATLQAH
ncbi:nuclear pore complex protein Nup205, putative [Ixodes scapularis]|uniref:Nuclear pore complex protein Nup205, putative n=1 Tax=Ixodes scapularis TaxID=6945 RepID=B7PZ59_IXOSC|nr:nuclear pore complex protein Nup205, putative [Ixodes scapularis]|eukprot:XP_002404822.1 nuclear pore complex protein Nup205, putative [Ixodes scapularis]